MKKVGIGILTIVALIAVMVIYDHPLMLRSSSYIDSATLVYVDTEKSFEGTIERETPYELSQEEYETLWNELRYNRPHYGLVLEYSELTHYVTFYFKNGDEITVKPHGELISVWGYKRGHLVDSFDLREAINGFLETREE